MLRTQYTRVSSIRLPCLFSPDSLPVAVLVLSIGWITLRFNGERALVEHANRKPIAVQPASPRYVDAEEANLQEGAYDTFDSFIRGRDVEMAVFDQAAG